MTDIRLLGLDLDFEPFVYEHHFVLPPSNRRYLQDVGLILRGRANFVNPSTRTAPHDVRLYLDGIEITPEYIAELKAVLTAADQALLRSQYREALRRWIELARALGTAYGGDVTSDEAEATRLGAVDPFSSLVDQLGNRATGFAGFLHVFSFLHGPIQLPPVSLHGVLHRAVTSGKKLDPLTIQRLTISNGPCRLFTTGWAAPASNGGIFLEADFVYHDPLEDRVRDLETRVTELERTLNEDLAEILDRLSSDGPIGRAVAAAQAAVGSATLSLGAARAEIGSQTAQLRGLDATARDLKNAVDAL